MKPLARIQHLTLKYLLKLKLNEEQSFMLLAILVGLVSGLVAIGLKLAILKLTQVMGTHRAFEWESLALGITAVFISGYITTRISNYTSGSGIPNLKLAIVARGGRIALRDTFYKAVTSILSLSSGFSLGREGPTITITGGIGSALGQWFALPKQKIKGLVAIGSSSGIAAAFNTPMAAIIFTMEEIIGDLNMKRLGPIVIGTVVAAVVGSLLDGGHATFTQLNYHLVNNSEMFVFTILGVLAGLLGPLWMKSVVATRSFDLKLFQNHRLTIIIVIYLFVFILGHIDARILGSGHYFIDEILVSKHSDWTLLLKLLMLKAFATALAYSSGISGGVFMPTLFIGAVLGALVGATAPEFFNGPTSAIGAYAVVGMGAFFVSVIRRPFTAIIIIFELTRNYEIILPLMIAIIVSHIISSKLLNMNLYQLISEHSGIHLPTNDDDHDLLEQMIVEDAMVSPVKSVYMEDKICDALKDCSQSSVSGYPVLNQQDRLVGMISRAEIRRALAEAQIENKETLRILDILKIKDVVTIYADQNLLMAFHKLNRFKVSRLPVVSRLYDGKVIGIITAENIVSQFGYHVAKEGDEKPNQQPD